MIIRVRKWFSDMFFVERIIGKWFWHISSSLNITFCWLCKDEVMVKHIGHNQDCMHYTKPVNDANDVKPPAHFDHCVGPKRTLYWSSAAFRSQLCLRGRDGIPHGGGVEVKNMTFDMNGVRSFFKIDPEVNKVEYSNVLDIHLVAPFCAHLDGFCIDVDLNDWCGKHVFSNFSNFMATISSKSRDRSSWSRHYTWGINRF